ncbi:MBL fold metallo-hydrolase [Metabacillus herbersteinensis]|uniref:MBL fold metallo-hydrolase n=1 Tax=Metabacillus herbersteinensis TaxID=283816 RepID=A0ABV6GCR6_9BACI
MNSMTSSEKVYQITLPTPFPVGDVNVYLVKGEKLTLVDTGPKTEEAWFSFQKQLQEIGYKPADIEQIVLTHHHPDHVGLTDYFSDSVPVIGHEYNRPWLKRDPDFMERQRSFFESLLSQFGVDKRFLRFLSQLNDTLNYSCNRDLHTAISEGDAIPGLDGWHVYETPGHAQSHIVLLQESDGLLLGGDTLLKKISANPLLELPMEGNLRPKPQLQFNASFKKLLELPISTVFSGHGESIDNAYELILHRMRKQKERAFLVRSFLDGQSLTAFQVCQQLFPAIYQKQLMLTMSETVGQLDYLEDIGEIKVNRSSEQHIYFVD